MSQDEELDYEIKRSARLVALLKRITKAYRNQFGDWAESLDGSELDSAIVAAETSRDVAR